MPIVMLLLLLLGQLSTVLCNVSGTSGNLSCKKNAILHVYCGTAIIKLAAKCH